MDTGQIQFVIYKCPLYEVQLPVCYSYNLDSKNINIAFPNISRHNWSVAPHLLTTSIKQIDALAVIVQRQIWTWNVRIRPPYLSNTPLILFIYFCYYRFFIIFANVNYLVFQMLLFELVISPPRFRTCWWDHCAIPNLWAFRWF